MIRCKLSYSTCSPIRTAGRALLLLAFATLAAFAQLTGSGTIAIDRNGAASPATETFAALASTGSTATVLPPGWYFLETGTNANGSYAPGNGSSNGGNTYSFGATDSADRSFGTLASGSLISRIGAQLVNNSGGVITSLTISYTGEQWRRGTATDDGLAFSYSTSATGLSDGPAFTNYPALNFNSPRCGSADSATDGKSDPCRTAITATITGLSVPPNGTVWIRWSDANNTGNDDGVAIDDVTLTATISLSSTPPTASGAATPATVAPGANVTLAGSVVAGSNPTSSSLKVSCNLAAIGGLDAQPLALDGSAFTFNTAAGERTAIGVYSLPCTVSDAESRSSDFTITLNVLPALNAACGAPATPVNVIQGSGSASPLAAQIVDIEGIVTASYQASSQLSGFFVQEPPETQDGNAATSEGIFVFAAAPAVNAGDRVRIRGTVTEFGTPPASTLTELTATSNASVCSTGNALPDPVHITLPLANAADWERYEGMLVQIDQQLVVTGNFSLGRFGQLDLAPSVLYQPTQTPGNAGTWSTAADLISRSRITLDDASNASDAAINGGTVAPFPAPGLSDDNTLRVGALVNPGADGPLPLTGIVDDRFGAYRIQPTSIVSFSNSPNPRQDTATLSAALSGRIRVVSSNVLNFFTTLGSRGAATATELDHQRTKLLQLFQKLNADVYGLSEVQNFANGQPNGGTYTNAALADLTSALAAATGRHYRFVDTISTGNIVGGDISRNGTDAIRNALIYDSSAVVLVGPAGLYSQDDSNRPSLAQTFQPAQRVRSGEQTFTVVVNHFRAKASTCGAGDDVYQGNCNATRLSMANGVRDWLSTNPTADPAGAARKVLLIGDFNAYYGEDPIQALEGAGGFTDLVNLLLGPSAYSYNFGSQAGYLDHALANPALQPLVKGILELHVNADEPAALQALDSGVKSAAAQLAYFAANEFAASDHDPILIALNPLAGDLDDNGIVEDADRLLIVSSFGKLASEVDRRLDLDGDGVITPADERLWTERYRTPGRRPRPVAAASPDIRE